jgi:hypothetical protein
MKTLKNHSNKNLRKLRSITTFMVGTLLLLSSYFIEAQHNWNVSLRSAANFPTKDFGDATLKMGVGFEGTISYQIFPHISGYAGWGWNSFTADKSFAGTDYSFVETGYRYGLHLQHPIGNSNIEYLVGAGGLYNHIEVENNGGDIMADSKHGFGWQVETGVVFPIGMRCNLTPTVRYQALARDIKIGGITTPVDLNYVSLGLAIGWSF